MPLPHAEKSSENDKPTDTFVVPADEDSIGLELPAESRARYEYVRTLHFRGLTESGGTKKGRGKKSRGERQDGKLGILADRITSTKGLNFDFIGD